MKPDTFFCYMFLLSFLALIRWAWLLSNQTISCFTNRIPMREKIPANHKRKDQWRGFQFLLECNQV